MELPFYISFKEFESHYEDDLEKWFSKYPDASETNYLKDILKIYSPFYTEKENSFHEYHYVTQHYWSTHKNDEVGFVRSCGDAKEFFKDDEGNVYRMKNVTHLEYIEIVVDKIKQHLKIEKQDSDNLELILDYLDNEEVITKEDSIQYELTYHIHEFYIPFIKEIISKSGSIVINPELYRNFGFSIVKIMNFINSKLNIQDPFGFDNGEDELISAYSDESDFEVQEEESESFKLFDKIRNGNFNDYDLTVCLKNFTQNYDTELLKSIQKDLSFYLFLEKEEMECNFSPEEIEQVIEERRKKGLEIPYIKRVPLDQLTEKQKENRQKAKEQGIDIDKPLINYEELLFPFEFYSLYTIRYKINSKLKELAPNENKDSLENTIDFDISGIKTNKTKTISLLHHTGILAFLRDKYPNITDNQLAGFFELLTKEPITARNQSTQFTKDKSSNKYPIKNLQDKEELDLILSRFGMKSI